MKANEFDKAKTDIDEALIRKQIQSMVAEPPPVPVNLDVKPIENAEVTSEVSEEASELPEEAGVASGIKFGPNHLLAHYRRAHPDVWHKAENWD